MSREPLARHERQTWGGIVVDIVFIVLIFPGGPIWLIVGLLVGLFYGVNQLAGVL